MSVLDTLASLLPRRRREPEVSRASLSDYFGWVTQAWRYGGNLYPTGASGFMTTRDGRPAEPIGNNFVGYVEGLLYADGPVAAVQQMRLRVFGQAPPLFQSVREGRPGDLYDDASLQLVRRPWPGATTSDMQKRSLLYADFGGNAYLVIVDDEIVVLRPDWVEIVLEPRLHEGGQVGWLQRGIVYTEGGVGANTPTPFLPGQYVHFCPLPDPLATYRGMSWLTPIIREIMGDKAAIEHKLSFLENSATPNLAISLKERLAPEQFKAFVDATEEQHRGATNAGKTLYTAGGADVTVVGASMQQLDFTALLGKAETRIANAAGIHPVLVGFSEGMQGSSLNAGNYVAAKRNVVDTTFRDLWQSWCGSLEVLFPPPNEGDRLWYDGRDIPFLHEDQKDLADIQRTQGLTVGYYVQQGFTPESAIAAVRADDLTLLVHTGMVSVQLLPPGQSAAAADAAAYPTGEDVLANADLPPEPPADSPTVARAYIPSQHPRNAVGEHLGEIPIGGRWKALTGGLRGVRDIAKALDLWARGEGNDDPLEGFSVSQLRRAARAQGLDRRGTRDVLAERILGDVRSKVTGRRHAVADRPVFSRGTGPDRPQARDGGGRLRDVVIRQAGTGLAVGLLDENNRPMHDAVKVGDFTQLRAWAKRNKLDDLTAWVDKYHPTTRGGLKRRRRRLDDLVARLRHTDTHEQAEDLLLDLPPGEVADLYRDLHPGPVSLPQRVTHRDLVTALMAAWPQLGDPGEVSPTGPVLASSSAGSTLELSDLADDAGVYGNADEWGQAGFGVSYLPDEGGG